MTKIQECPRCKLKFTRIGDVIVHIDEEVPDGIVRCILPDGRIEDVCLIGVGQDMVSDQSKSSAKSPT